MLLVLKNLKKVENNKVILDLEITNNYLKKSINAAYQDISEKAKIPGFRKGKIPENVMLQNIPEIKILEEMAEMALGEHYPKILEEINQGEKIDALDVIGQPEIFITKLARKNPLGFKIKTAVLPPVKLPDYKDIAKKINSKIEIKSNFFIYI